MSFVNIARGGQDASKVSEVWNNGELLTINGEDDHFWLVSGLLHHDLCFGDIDFESNDTVYGGDHI